MNHLMRVDEALEHVAAVQAARGNKKPRAAATVMETLANEVHRQRAERAELDAAVGELLDACCSVRECNAGEEPWDNLCDAEGRVRTLRAKLGIKP